MTTVSDELVRITRKSNMTIPMLHAKLALSGFTVNLNSLRGYFYGQRSPRPSKAPALLAALKAIENDKHRTQECLVGLKRITESGVPHRQIGVRHIDNGSTLDRPILIQPYYEPSLTSNASKGAVLPVVGAKISANNCSGDSLAIFNKLYEFCSDDAVVFLKVRYFLDQAPR